MSDIVKEISKTGRINILAIFYWDVTTNPILEPTNFALLSKLDPDEFNLFLITHAKKDKIDTALSETLRIPPSTRKRWVIPFYNKYINSIIDFFFMIMVVLRYKIDFLYCKDIYLAFWGIVIKSLFRKKIIFRMEGVPLVERLYQGHLKKYSIESYLLKFVERFIIRKSDIIIPVSHPMADYIKSMGRKDVEMVLPIPCVIKRGKFIYDSQIRRAKREELNLDEKIVFIYSGGAWKWQCLRESVSLFNEISKIDKNVHLILLSYQEEQVKKIISDVLNKDMFTILSVPHDKVHEYLMASDAGFLLREDNKINEVASPIKYGEYIGCGLPVIMTSGIGDCSDITQKNNFGVVLDTQFERDIKRASEEVIEFLKTIDEDTRKKNSEWANENYSLDKYAKYFCDKIIETFL
jgi:hypothetical protein